MSRCLFPLSLHCRAALAAIRPNGIHVHDARHCRPPINAPPSANRVPTLQALPPHRPPPLSRLVLAKPRHGPSMHHKPLSPSCGCSTLLLSPNRDIETPRRINGPSSASSASRTKMTQATRLALADMPTESSGQEFLGGRNSSLARVALKVLGQSKCLSNAVVYVPGNGRLRRRQGRRCDGAMTSVLVK